MNLAFSLAAAVLFGCGAVLLVRGDLLRMVAGVALISQSAVVVIIASALTRGPAPIDAPEGQVVADPLPQALALTALVIGLATVALLLALVHRAAVAARSADREELAALEAEVDASLARWRAHDQEETA